MLQISLPENFLFFFIYIFIISILNIWLSFIIAKNFKLYDYPEKRKIHKIPILINGGIFLYLNLIFYIIYYLIYFKSFDIFPLREILLFFLTTSVCFFVGLIDDKNNLRIIVRYTIILFFLLIFLDLSILLKITNLKFFLMENKYFFKIQNPVLITSIVIIIFIIMYNLFDGINLQSSLISIFYLSYLSLFQYQTFMIMLNFSFILSLIIFSFFNFKNISFLGNSGINLVGLIILINIIIANNNEIQESNIDFFFVLLMFIFPGLDMFRLFFIRLINNGSPFNPDKNHIHHLMIKRFSQITSSLILLFCIMWPIFIHHILNKNYTLQLIVLQIILYYLIIYILSRKKI